MSEKDIVERLRNYATCTDSDVDEAANTIERLRDERDEFRYSADDAVKELLEAEEALARALTQAAEMRDILASVRVDVQLLDTAIECNDPRRELRIRTGDILQRIASAIRELKVGG